LCATQGGCRSSSSSDGEIDRVPRTFNWGYFAQKGQVVFRSGFFFMTHKGLADFFPSQRFPIKLREWNLKGEQISLVPLAAVALEGEFVEISSLVRRRNAFRHRDVRLQSRSFAR